MSSIICIICHKEKKYPPSDIKNGAKYCSIKCKNIGYGLKYSKEKHSQWKGGKTVNSVGYVLIRNTIHPFSGEGYVYEHRLIMEKKLGRYLLPTEIIHHKNHIKNDNRIENLELIKNQSEHIKHEFATGGMQGSKKGWFKKGHNRWLS